MEAKRRILSRLIGGRFLRTHLVLVLSLLAASPSLAANFTGNVIGVLDGDTIEVLHNLHPERIRLSGIDCPEKGQAFGQKAKQAACSCPQLFLPGEGFWETFPWRVVSGSV